MKKIYKAILSTCIIASLVLFKGYAQITVDANLKDWGDSTQFKYDEQNRLWYNFKKDEQFLYIAIKKNQNASKYQMGGVQIVLSSSNIDTNSLQITFAQSLIIPNINTYVKESHDYFEIRNYKNIKKQLLAKFNETGIFVEWSYTNIDFRPKKPAYNSDEVPADPNIFIAEVQIPLSNLPKTLNYGFRLPGTGNLGKTGKKELMSRNLFKPPTNIGDEEMIERLYLTEHYGKLDLTKL